jgi:transglutaminase-like putative cysteine protease
MKNFLFTLKTATIIFLFTASQANAQSQLMVSAGSDQKLCWGAYADLNAFVSGGVPPYTFKWTPNAEVSSGNSQAIVATPTYNTTFKVIVTDAKGNVARDEVYVEVNQRPTIKANTYVSIEPKGKVRLEASVSGGTGSYAYSWKPTLGLDNPTSAAPTASPDGTITYALMVKDSKGCIATEQISVNVNNASRASIEGRERK